MCRLFGMSAGRSPVRATFWLLDAPDSLVMQSRREPDGTGIGWFDEAGTPQLRKQPIAAYSDADFGREAREISSRTFVAHIRFASTGSLLLRNTHPFEQDGRLFAHNGVIEELAVLEDHLGEDLRLVKGDTDSERLFALITREIAARDGDVGEGIARRLRVGRGEPAGVRDQLRARHGRRCVGASLSGDASASRSRARAGGSSRAHEQPGQPGAI